MSVPVVLIVIVSGLVLYGCASQVGYTYHGDVPPVIVEFDAPSSVPTENVLDIVEAILNKYEYDTSSGYMPNEEITPTSERVAVFGERNIRYNYPEADLDKVERVIRIMVGRDRPTNLVRMNSWIEERQEIGTSTKKVMGFDTKYPRIHIMIRPLTPDLETEVRTALDEIVSRLEELPK